MSSKKVLSGFVRTDNKTKTLIKRLKSGEIAVIDHRDLDEVSAKGLIRKKCKAVINFDNFTTGRYPNKGPLLLDKAKIVMVEVEGDINLFTEGDYIKIKAEDIYKDNNLILRGARQSRKKIMEKMNFAYKKLPNILEEFVDNTLEYASKEKDLILGKYQVPEVKTKFNNRQTLVVTRGQSYREDLHIIMDYILAEKPVLIGVDGGADALLELGLIPDIVIGDMDSVSDTGLRKSREIISHAYLNGKTPAKERLEKLGVDYKTFVSLGTSEDIALLLAYEKGADLIVTVGSHSNMIDFLEKGRPGMASTFLVRLKVGTKLVDATGVYYLYKKNNENKYIFATLTAAMLPILILYMYSPMVQNFFSLILLRIKL